MSDLEVKSSIATTIIPSVILVVPDILVGHILKALLFIDAGSLPCLSRHFLVVLAKSTEWTSNQCAVFKIGQPTTMHNQLIHMTG